MRREENSRKKKRDEVKERKEREKEQRREELKQLKAMKKKEILDKMNKLKKIAGTDGLEFQDDDLEGDFDPEEYDKRMAQVFGSYDDAAVENEGEKPVFSDLDLDSDLENEMETENWDDWTGNPEQENNEDGEENGEEEEEEEEDLKQDMQNEIIESTRRGKKRRKSKFAEALERKKPLYKPGEDETFDKYLDEYYKLDYEDVIGDTKCRFQYRDVAANDFGLDVNEILSAPDRELNAWCSLKKTCMYRTEDEEAADVNTFKGKKNNVTLKKKVLPSLFTENPEEELQAEKDKKSAKGKKKKKQDEEEDDEEKVPPPEPSEPAKLSKSAKKRLKKKERDAKRKSTGSNAEDIEEAPPASKKVKLDCPGSTSKKNKHNKKHDKKNEINADIKMSDDRLKAYGLAPNRFKREKRKKKFRAKEEQN